GSALSVADILAALYGGVLNVDNPSDPEQVPGPIHRDRPRRGRYLLSYRPGGPPGNRPVGVRVGEHTDPAGAGRHRAHRLLSQRALHVSAAQARVGATSIRRLFTMFASVE